MREAIRQRLLAAIPALNGQAFDLNEDVGSAQTPYVVIVHGPDTAESGWAGIRRTFEVWPYAGAGGGFDEVDDLADSVIQALDEQVLAEALTGESFVCRYQGSAEGDRVNEAKTAITRGIRFAVWGLPTGAEPSGAVADDSWLAALGGWSSEWLGSPWQVHLNAWPLALAKPAVLWRVRGMETGARNAAAHEVRKRVVGHFLGTSRNETLAAAYEAIGRLQAAAKLALDPVARTFLKVTEVGADMQADGLTAGQVNLTLSRLETQPAAEAPLMQKVSIYSKD